MYMPSKATAPDAASGSQAAFSQWRGHQLRIKEVTFLVFLLLAAPMLIRNKARVRLCGLWQNSCNVGVAEGRLEYSRPGPMTLPALDLLHIDRSINGTVYQLICGKDAQTALIKGPALGCTKRCQCLETYLSGVVQRDF